MFECSAYKRMLGAAAVVLVAGTAAMAQPANDTCDSATPIGVETLSGQTTAGATLDIAGPCASDTKDVWYLFTAPDARPYVFTATGSNNSDLSLSLVSGCGFPYALDGCSTGSGVTGPTAQQNFFFAGQTELVRIGSTTDQTFSVSVTPLPPPANDECGGAIPVFLDTVINSNNLAATTSLSLTDQQMCESVADGFAGGSDVFYVFTPSATGYYDVATCGSDIDTVVSVHSACPATAANAIACNDNGPIHACDIEGDQHSSYLAGVPMTAGVSYYIRVASVVLGDTAPQANFNLLVTEGQQQTVPTNTSCAAAIALDADSVISGTTIHAPASADSPCGYQDVFAVWYTFTSPASDKHVFQFTIVPGSFGTSATMTAYDGCDGNVLGCSSFNPFTTPDMTMSVALDPGQTMYLRVAGQNATQDDFALQTVTGDPAASNASCDTALPLTVGPAINVDTTSAANSGGNVCGSNDLYALWYTFTAPSAGYYRFDTELPDGNFSSTSLMVFDSCTAADPIICRSNGDSMSSNPSAAAVSLNLAGGQTVYIRAAMNDSNKGPFTLQASGPLASPPSVANDVCSSATSVTSMPFTETVDVTAAGQDQDVCIYQDQTTSTYGGIWYTYTPSSDVFLLASATTNDQNRTPHITVFTGSCGALTQFVCPPFQQANNPIPLTAGTTYHILVSLDSGGQILGTPQYPLLYGTTITPSFEVRTPPANDHCSTATRITDPSAVVDVDNLVADSDTPEPSCFGYLDGGVGGVGKVANGVWYTFTTTSAGSITVTGTNSDPDRYQYSPGGALFTGTCGSLTEVACGTPASGFFLKDNFTFTTNVNANQTYYLVVGSYSSPVGGSTHITFSSTATFGSGCAADFDGNSTVNVSDIFAFLRAWFSHSPSADIDGNSTVNVSDIFAFLRHWFSHC